MDEREQKMAEEELADLAHELEMFKEEKERVRAIVGKIGGIPTFNTRLFNVIFGVCVVVCLAVSLLTPDARLKLAVIEIAVAAVSVKIMYLIHSQGRTTHFQLWILSSLEWRLNEIMKAVRALGGKKEDGA